MTLSSSSARTRLRSHLDRVLLTGAAALALSAFPISLSADGPFLGSQAAFARGGNGGDGGQGGGNGNGNGNDNGNGGDRGRDASERGGPDRAAGARGHAYGQERGRGGQGAGASGYHDLNEFVDSVRNGRAVGVERRDERIEEARGRYGEALGRTDRGRHGSVGEAGPAAHHFSPEETQALIERGWKGPRSPNAGFRNHGQRVSTMVELSKRLGYGARVGALQANFGTPYENEIASLQDQLEAARAAGDLAEVERLEGELADAIASAKPGLGPDDSWASADLDVNDDGAVDQRDLDALDESAASPDAAGETPAG